MSTPVINSKPLIVGLAGPSGSGKSTVARRVASRLNGQVISMETYSTSMNHLPLEQRAKINYDAPEAIDIALLASHIAQYARGEAIDLPIYDFSEHLRVANRTVHLAVKPLLIVEGILALHFAQLRPHYNLAIYLTVADETCYRRRQVRDITERQRSLDLIRWQYENTVLPAQRQFLLPSKSYADVVIDSGPDVDTVEEGLVRAIENKQGLAAGK